MQVLSCAVVALVYLLALLKVKPYVDRSSHSLNAPLTIALLIICIYSAGAGFAEPLAEEVAALLEAGETNLPPGGKLFQDRWTIL